MCNQLDVGKKITGKRKIIRVIVVLTVVVILKFLFYDGIATCKPMKYRGTILGAILGYDKSEGLSRKDQFNRMVPRGMPVQDLMAQLKRQGIQIRITNFYYDYPDVPVDSVTVSHSGYFKIDVPPPDYVVGVGRRFVCIFGEYWPAIAIWIKDDKVYKTTYRVDRTFI